mmetsp:Transcript_15301/g.48048  ORF Transcript_15301/g.48048 Transcript_15301/m.48048 type:complete len:213 (+) Transcript_15301:132-770(+)
MHGIAENCATRARRGRRACTSYAGLYKANEFAAPARWLSLWQAPVRVPAQELQLRVPVERDGKPESSAYAASRSVTALGSVRLCRGDLLNGPVGAVCTAQEGRGASHLDGVPALVLGVSHGEERVVRCVQRDHRLGHERDVHEATREPSDGKDQERARGCGGNPDDKVQEELDEPEQREDAGIDHLARIHEEPVEEDQLNYLFDGKRQREVL